MYIYIYIYIYIYVCVCVCVYLIAGCMSRNTILDSVAKKKINAIRKD